MAPARLFAFGPAICPMPGAHGPPWSWRYEGIGDSTSFSNRQSGSNSGHFRDGDYTLRWSAFRIADLLPCPAHHLRVTLLARWHATPHLVEEVQQKRHVNRTILTGRLRHWKNREALSVCGYVEVRYPALIANLRIRPETWLSRRERATGHRVVDDHNTIVGIGVEQFPAGLTCLNFLYQT